MFEVKVTYSKIVNNEPKELYGTFAVAAATKEEAIAVMSTQVTDFLRLMGGTLVSIS